MLFRNNRADVAGGGLYWTVSGPDMVPCLPPRTPSNTPNSSGLRVQVLPVQAPPPKKKKKKPMHILPPSESTLKCTLKSTDSIKSTELNQKHRTPPAATAGQSSNPTTRVRAPQKSWLAGLMETAQCGGMTVRPTHKKFWWGGTPSTASAVERRSFP